MTYSSDFQREVNRVSGTEPILILLEINHADLITPIRIVNDREDLVSNGVTYQGIYFGCTLPNDPESGSSRAQLTVDNVGRELTQWIDYAKGAPGATATISQVRRSAPDDIEFSVTLDLSNIHLDTKYVTADLTFDDIVNRPGLVTLYTPDRAPGLF